MSIQEASETSESWPDWLRSQLILHKVAPEDLAVVMATDLVNMTQWLSGTAMPPSAVLNLLAATLQCDRADLDERLRTHFALTPPRTDPFSELLARVNSSAADL